MRRALSSIAVLLCAASCSDRGAPAPVLPDDAAVAPVDDGSIPLPVDGGRVDAGRLVRDLPVLADKPKFDCGGRSLEVAVGSGRQRLAFELGCESGAPQITLVGRAPQEVSAVLWEQTWQAVERATRRGGCQAVSSGGGIGLRRGEELVSCRPAGDRFLPARRALERAANVARGLAAEGDQPMLITPAGVGAYRLGAKAVSINRHVGAVETTTDTGASYEIGSVDVEVSGGVVCAVTVSSERAATEARTGPGRALSEFVEAHGDLVISERRIGFERAAWLSVDVDGEMDLEDRDSDLGEVRVTSVTVGDCSAKP